jgi:hypothetical protein
VRSAIALHRSFGRLLPITHSRCTGDNGDEDRTANPMALGWIGLGLVQRSSDVGGGGDRRRQLVSRLTVGGRLCGTFAPRSLRAVAQVCEQSIDLVLDVIVVQQPASVWGHT